MPLTWQPAIIVPDLHRECRSVESNSAFFFSSSCVLASVLSSPALTFSCCSLYVQLLTWVFTISHLVIASADETRTSDRNELPVHFLVRVYLFFFLPKTIGNRKGDCAWGTWDDKHHLRKSQDCKAKINKELTHLSRVISSLRSADFLS